MSWRWKCVLLVLVCTVHISVLFAFDPKHRSSTADTPQRASVHSMALYTIPAFSVEAVRQSRDEPTRIRGIKSVEPLQALQRPLLPIERLIMPPAFPGTNDPGSALDAADFLAADAVDETALPEEHFEEVLKQSLPLGLEAIELEIWVDHTGNTVLVQCLDQENCGDSLDGLKRLLALRFKPAIKDGLPVSSRKHIYIHIDPPPTFGL